MADADDAFEVARLHFLDGLAALEADRLSEAEAQFTASLALLPGRVSTLINLAAVHMKLGQPAEAWVAAGQVLAIEPRNIEALFHQGTALAELGRHDEALVALTHLIAIDASRAEPWMHHGFALHTLGRPHDALASYDRALAIDPSLAQAWSHRGGILREAMRLEEAAEAFEQAIARGADAELYGYYLASVRANAATDRSATSAAGTGAPRGDAATASADTAAIPTIAPAHYVQSLFDDYAAEFDHHLIDLLHYRAHIVLTQPLAALAADPASHRTSARFASALDLGCGTGLCAPLVRPLADRLTGIDLSAGMLDQAHALDLYDELTQADAAAYLQATDERFDLILAADVFIYIGDLAPLFASARRVMPPGGVFCFSAEQASRESLDFELLPSLRYAHAERYLRELAAVHGFEVTALTRQPIREDQREAIAGLFVYLRRH
ncbi:tetratricopeptide repeat protein [soil metagenome]